MEELKLGEQTNEFKSLALVPLVLTTTGHCLLPSVNIFTLSD